MDDPINHQLIPSDNHGSVQNFVEFLGFDREIYTDSRTFLINTMKNTLLFGADRVLLARKGKSFRNKEFVDDDNGCNPNKFLCNEEHVDVSKVVNCHSKGYNEFPFNILAFSAILALELIGFQIHLVTSFLTSFLSLPIWLSYSTIMFFLFPFRTLSKIRDHLTQRVFKMWADFYFTITSFIFARIKAQKHVLNLAIRFGWAFSCSVYVCFVLVGLLILGFLLGGFAMSRLVEKPIQTTEAINFDYTKASPVAFVPIAFSPGAGVSSGMVSRERVEAEESAKVLRAIPYDHKLRLTVSLTLPESEYNTKLGVFQVRVEFLSANGKVTASSSHPCMLRFKSHPIRLAETAFKSVPVITGFHSEAQTLTIKVGDFTEGYEPTACLKVVLEQRAEYKPGAGIPQLYAASIALESELPRFKKMIWCWRRTVFVWISVVLFLTEVVIVLVFFRPLIMPRGRAKAVGAKKDSAINKISWSKGI